jgi:hypothetical protein
VPWPLDEPLWLLDLLIMSVVLVLEELFIALAAAALALDTAGPRL